MIAENVSRRWGSNMDLCCRPGEEFPAARVGPNLSLLSVGCSACAISVLGAVVAPHLRASFWHLPPLSTVSTTAARRYQQGRGGTKSAGGRSCAGVSCCLGRRHPNNCAATVVDPASPCADVQRGEISANPATLRGRRRDDAQYREPRCGIARRAARPDRGAPDVRRCCTPFDVMVEKVRNLRAMPDMVSQRTGIIKIRALSGTTFLRSNG